MPSLTSPAPRVNGNRQREPLLPVRVTGRLTTGINTGLADLFAGCAVLSVYDAAGGETMYWCEAIVGAGKIVGLKLTKFRTGEQRHVHLTAGGAECDCEDATYRPGRPGGCRHVVALTQALSAAAGGRS